MKKQYKKRKRAGLLMLDAIEAEVLVARKEGREPTCGGVIDTFREISGNGWPSEDVRNLLKDTFEKHERVIASILDAIGQNSDQLKEGG